MKNRDFTETQQDITANHQGTDIKKITNIEIEMIEASNEAEAFNTVINTSTIILLVSGDSYYNNRIRTAQRH